MAEPDPPTATSGETRTGRRAVPVWAALAVGVILLVGAGWVVLRPEKATCEYSETLCRVDRIEADLDRIRESIEKLGPDADVLSELSRIESFTGELEQLLERTD